MIDEKPWWQSRTILVNVVTFIVAIFTTLETSDWLKPEQVAIVTGLAIPVVNVILRWLTNKPVTFRMFKRKKK